MDCETFLLEQGYDTTSTGGFIFSLLLEEVLCMMNDGASNKEIQKELKNIYNLYIYRVLKTNGQAFFSELVSFLKSKVPANKRSVGKVDVALIRLGRKYCIENAKGKVKIKQKSKHK